MAHHVPLPPLDPARVLDRFLVNIQIHDPSNRQHGRRPVVKSHVRRGKTVKVRPAEGGKQEQIRSRYEE